MGETEKVVGAPKKSWFTGLKAEFRKIIWPDKKSLGKQTMAVIVTSIALGLIITVIDIIAQYGVNILVNL
ncbi:MAG: preprotein translocase subunit SecE [Lachnospiraceae bacterium]